MLQPEDVRGPVPAPSSSPGSWQMLYERWSSLLLPSSATPPASSPYAAILLPQAPHAWAWPRCSDTCSPDAGRSQPVTRRPRGFASQSSSCLAPALAFLLSFLSHPPTYSPTRPPPTMPPIPLSSLSPSLGRAVRTCTRDRQRSAPAESRVWSQATRVHVQLHHQLCDLGVSRVYPSGPRCLSGTMRRRMVPTAWGCCGAQVSL